jgi:lipoprotein-anchoring transpeptidase ErfK/SrfK
MTLGFRNKCRRAASLSALMLMPLLSGCLFVTDTSRMNPDVFVWETAPIFQYHEGGNVTRAPLPPTPGAITNRAPDLFRNSFQQKYGPPDQEKTHAPMRTQRPGEQQSLWDLLPKYGPQKENPLTLNQLLNENAGYAPASAAPPRASQSRGYGLPVSNPLHRMIYGGIRDEDRTLPAIPYQRVDQRYLRQEVAFQSNEKPGTIIVDTKAHFLYLVEGNGKAIRYGVGLGKDGHDWSGRGKIQWKAKWPRWTPPDEMVSRQPELASVSSKNGGMGAGLNNPLGARALYIFKDGKDTLYRVHGTPDWQSVGKATSSGCVRMFNQDVIDLYERVPQGAEIVVI